MGHGMKAKSIKSILRNKINDWLKSIDDKELKKLCERDVIVTGGCISSMLLGEDINDFDIYFRTYDTTLKVAQYYVNKFQENLKVKNPVDMKVECLKDIRGEDRIRIVVKSAGVESVERTEDYKYFEYGPDEQTESYVENIYDSVKAAKQQDLTLDKLGKKQKKSTKKYRPIFLSTNAITLEGNIQMVLRFFGEPDEIHKNYDFIHCTNYWIPHNDELVLRPEALQTLLSKTLVYQGSRYPVASMFRLRKFIERGWRINAGQMLKIALQISDLNLYDYNVLEDQLTGVDVAYFEEVLKKVNYDDKNKIESAYLIEIIDEMFGE